MLVFNKNCLQPSKSHNRAIAVFLVLLAIRLAPEQTRAQSVSPTASASNSVSNQVSKQVDNSAPDPAPNIDPGQPDPACLINRGLELARHGNVAEAEVFFKEFFRTHPHDPTGFFWAGKVADENGRSQDALHNYVRSLDLAKAIGMDSEELRLNLGNTLLKLGYYKEATYDFERAIEINGKNTLAHYNLAKLFLVTGQDDKALSELNNCSALGMNDPHVTLLRAWALKRLGQLEDSRLEGHRFLDQALPNESTELQEFARSQF